MTDKIKIPEQNNSSSPEQNKKIESPKVVTDKPSMQNSAKQNQKTPITNKNKISKISLLALLISVIALTSAGVIHFWHTNKSIILEKNLVKQNDDNNFNNDQKIQNLVNQQKISFDQQLTQIVNDIQRQNQIKISELEAKVNRLGQNQPNDWLVHEAEYLVRIAARTMWLERDTQAAVGLLQDADNRLAELNDPKYLPVRQLIHQDIEQLKLLPRLNVEKIVLTLMGLNSQIKTLPLAFTQTTQEINSKDRFELSNNIADWRENLGKTWLKFIDTFVVIHSRKGTAEPLLSPQHLDNLKENLSLKLQQVQWSAREEQAELYQQNLNEIQTWFSAYFDMSNERNQLFIATIESLKSERVTYNYPSTLSSLTAIRGVLEDRILPIASDIQPEEEKQDNGALPTIPVDQSSIEDNASIEEQVHQQTVIQEKLDKQKQLGKDEL